MWLVSIRARSDVSREIYYTWCVGVVKAMREILEEGCVQSGDEVTRDLRMLLWHEIL